MLCCVLGSDLAYVRAPGQLQGGAAWWLGLVGKVGGKEDRSGTRDKARHHVAVWSVHTRGSTALPCDRLFLVT